MLISACLIKIYPPKVLGFAGGAAALWRGAGITAIARNAGREELRQPIRLPERQAARVMGQGVVVVVAQRGGSPPL